jgi:hypothetical protein
MNNKNTGKTARGDIFLLSLQLHQQIPPENVRRMPLPLHKNKKT